jgi:Ni/Co efflux regulator RcnB
MKRILSIGLAVAAATMLPAAAQERIKKDGERDGRRGGRDAVTVRTNTPDRTTIRSSGNRTVVRSPDSSSRTVIRSNDAGTRVTARTRSDGGSTFRTTDRIADRNATVALTGRSRTVVRDRDNDRDRGDRDWDRDRDRDRDWDRDRDRDRRIGVDVRFRRPPIDVYRGWNRGRIYTWNNHRYHWHGGDWVIVDTPATYAYTTYSSGSLTAQVQARLADRGYSPGPIDGEMGPATSEAIADFQADRGLPVTGRIDTPLVRALGL